MKKLQKREEKKNSSKDFRKRSENFFFTVGKFQENQQICTKIWLNSWKFCIILVMDWFKMRLNYNLPIFNCKCQLKKNSQKLLLFLCSFFGLFTFRISLTTLASGKDFSKHTQNHSFRMTWNTLECVLEGCCTTFKNYVAFHVCFQYTVFQSLKRDDFSNQKNSCIETKKLCEKREKWF